MAEVFANSTLISYQQSFTTLSSPNGTIRLIEPLKFDVQDTKKVRLIRASITSSIPNIYHTAGFNNGLVKCSRDGGLTWVDVQCPDGIYTMHHIQKAINETLEDLGWWIDPADPGILLEFNLATLLTYVQLTSSKLAPGGVQLAIDFSFSDINKLLGFQTTQMFDVDGLHGASHQAQLNWVGDNVSVQIGGIGGLSYRNSSSSTEICQIPLSTAQVLNEYVYPSAGIISPLLNAAIPQKLDTLTFTFTGSRSDVVGGATVYRPIYVLDGEVNITINIVWQ